MLEKLEKVSYKFSGTPSLALINSMLLVSVFKETILSIKLINSLVYILSKSFSTIIILQNYQISINCENKLKLRK